MDMTSFYYILSVTPDERTGTQIWNMLELPKDTTRYQVEVRNGIYSKRNLHARKQHLQLPYRCLDLTSLV
jgi:hypothetical protein